MALSVFGAGWGRTGTSSLKLALEQLGIGPCHHMSEVMGNPKQMEHWGNIADEKFDWDGVFEGYNSACDWPSSHYWRELAAYYPDAKVILTTRPGEEWWGSYSKTIMQGFLAVDKAGVDDPMLKFLYEISVKMFKKTANCEYHERDKFIAACDAYEQIVRDYFVDEPQRLLVFNVKEGWSPLCQFLGVPMPDTDFPRANDTEAFLKSQPPSHPV